MKKLLISLGAGITLTLVFSILAGMGGGACHCNTPLQVLFPFMSMLGVHAADGTLGELLWAVQMPVYALSVAYAPGANWKGIALFAIVIVHVLAVSIAASA